MANARGPLLSLPNLHFLFFKTRIFVEHEEGIHVNKCEWVFPPNYVFHIVCPIYFFPTKIISKITLVLVFPFVCG